MNQGYIGHRREKNPKEIKPLSHKSSLTKCKQRQKSMEYRAVIQILRYDRYVNFKIIVLILLP